MLEKEMQQNVKRFEMKSSLSGQVEDPFYRKKRCWHVIYARVRHEKRIHSEMLEMGIESFLPMKKELHVWSDRKKWIEVPLFSSYIFANVTPQERSRVYLLNGFVKFVSSNGKPSIVPQWQIDGIRKFVEIYPDRIDVLESDYVGTEGVIISGPLAGLHGRIVDVKNKKCFTMRVDGIEKVLSLTIPVSSFMPLDELNRQRQAFDNSGLQSGDRRLKESLIQRTPSAGQPGSSTIP